MNRWWASARLLTRGVWFRASLYSVGGLGVAVVAWIASRWLPSEWSVDLGQGAVSSILQILASSMLAVTTFSLTAMVSAYSAASTSGTPRSTQLLIADRTSQNALSTYVGAFAFSIIGIIALSLNIYSESGKTLLFLGSVVVVIAVLVSLLRWIDFLTSFGRVADVIDRVQDAAEQSMQAYTDDPLMGASGWTEPPTDGTAVQADLFGYLVTVNVDALAAAVEKAGARAWILVRPGARTSPQTPLVILDRAVSAEVEDAVRDAFVVARHRTFDQDPRLGLIALSEIAGKALSAATNDPGTAIDALRAIHEVLAKAQQLSAPEVRHEHVHLRPVAVADFVIDALRPTARDGATTVEVGVRFQSEIASLIRSAPDEVWRAALQDMADRGLSRSLDCVTAPDEVAELRWAHSQSTRDDHLPR